MRYLGSVELPEGRGSRRGLLTTDEATGTQLLAFVWVDRDRRYFVSTASSLEEGAAIQRYRWSQLDKTTPNAEPERVEKNIAQPIAAETYYKGSGKIDQHNRHRQDTLQLERKLQTNDWHKRVNMTIFGMCVIDAFLLAKGCCVTGSFSNPACFIELLAADLIDNDYDRISLRRRTHHSNKKRSREVDIPALPLQVDTTIYLTNTTPTKRRKKGSTSQCKQGRCMVCKKAMPTTVCRECQRFQPDPSKKQFWCCKSGSICFDRHIRMHHPDKLMINSP